MLTTDRRVRVGTNDLQSRTSALYAIASLGYVWSCSQQLPSILLPREGNGHERVAYAADSDLNMEYMRFLTLHGTQTGWHLQYNNGEGNAGGQRSLPLLRSATASIPRPPRHPVVRVNKPTLAPKIRGKKVASHVMNGEWFASIGNVHVGITQEHQRVINFAIVVAKPRSAQQPYASAVKFTTATVTATREDGADDTLCRAVMDGTVMDAAPDGAGTVGGVPEPDDGVPADDDSRDKGDVVTINGVTWTVVVTSCGCDVAKAWNPGHVHSCWVHRSALHVGIEGLRTLHKNDIIQHHFTRRTTAGGGAVTVTADKDNAFVPYFRIPQDTPRHKALHERLVRALQDCLLQGHNSNNVVHLIDSRKENIYMTVEWHEGGFNSHLVRIDRNHHASCSCSKASSKKGKAPRRRSLQTNVAAQRVRTGCVCGHVMMCLRVCQRVDDVDSDDAMDDTGAAGAARGEVLPRANKFVYYDTGLGRYVVPGVVTRSSPALCDDNVPDDILKLRQSRKRAQTSCAEDHGGQFPYNHWDYSQYASVTDMQATEDAQLLRAAQIHGGVDEDAGNMQWDTCNNEVLVYMRDGPVVIVVPDLWGVDNGGGTHTMLCDCGVLDVTRLSVNEAVANEVLWDYLHATGATGTGRGGVTITQFWQCLLKTYPAIPHVPPCNPVGFRAIYAFCANLAAGGACPVGDEDTVADMLCPFCGQHPSVLVIDASTAAILGNNARRSPLVTVTIPKPTRFPPKCVWHASTAQHRRALVRMLEHMGAVPADHINGIHSRVAATFDDVPQPFTRASMVKLNTIAKNLASDVKISHVSVGFAVRRRYLHLLTGAGTDFNASTIDVVQLAADITIAANNDDVITASALLGVLMSDDDGVDDGTDGSNALKLLRYLVHVFVLPSLSTATLDELHMVTAFCADSLRLRLPCTQVFVTRAGYDRVRHFMTEHCGDVTEPLPGESPTTPTAWAAQSRLWGMLHVALHSTDDTLRTCCVEYLTSLMVVAKSWYDLGAAAQDTVGESDDIPQQRDPTTHNYPFGYARGVQQRHQVIFDGAGDVRCPVEGCCKDYQQDAVRQKKGMHSLFCCVCPHGFWYGSHIVGNAEGRNDATAFELFYDSVVMTIYDFNCGTLRYKMNRGLNWANVAHYLDSFHANCHKCGGFFHIPNNVLHTLNSSVVEQLWTMLSPQKRSFTRMAQETYALVVEVYFVLRNRCRQRNLLKDEPVVCAGDTFDTARALAQLGLEAATVDTAVDVEQDAAATAITPGSSAACNGGGVHGGNQRADGGTDACLGSPAGNSAGDGDVPHNFRVGEHVDVRDWRYSWEVHRLAVLVARSAMGGWSVRFDDGSRGVCTVRAEDVYNRGVHTLAWDTLREHDAVDAFDNHESAAGWYSATVLDVQRRGDVLMSVGIKWDEYDVTRRLHPDTHGTLASVLRRRTHGSAADGMEFDAEATAAAVAASLSTRCLPCNNADARSIVPARYGLTTQ